MGICAENVNNLFAFLILLYVVVCVRVCARVWPVRLGQAAWHAYRLSLCRLEIPLQMQRGSVHGQRLRASILGLTCCMASGVELHLGRWVRSLGRIVIQVSYKNRTLIYRCHRLLPLHGHIIFIFHGGVASISVSVSISISVSVSIFGPSSQLTVDNGDCAWPQKGHNLRNTRPPAHTNTHTERDRRATKRCRSNPMRETETESELLLRETFASYTVCG